MDIGENRTKKKDREVRASVSNGLISVHHRLPDTKTQNFSKSIACIGNSHIKLQFAFPWFEVP